MTSLIWRLHRNQVWFASAVLVVLAVVLLITGHVMADDYRNALANCAATPGCTNAGNLLFRGDGAIMDIVDLTLVVPLLFGLFWGAPLLAKEFEDGTNSLVWTQTVTRRRWLSSNVAWALLAAAVWGAAMAALVSWWRFPENALGTRFDAFDIQGIAPAAYSLFAVSLGIAIGSVIKRVLPALATTLGIFVGLRAVIAIYLRPHYLTPTKQVIGIGADPNGPSGAWVISSSIVGPHGQVYGDSFSPSDVPKACLQTFFDKQGISGHCMATHGFHQLVSFQAANRFWAFQGIEAAIFLVLAAGLIGFAFWRVLSRDA